MKPLHRLRSVRLAGWAVSGAVAHAAFGAVSTIILARALGPAGLGAYGVFLAVAFLLNQLGEMGLGTAYVRLATPGFQQGDNPRPLHWTFLGARILSVALLGVVGVAFGRTLGRAVGASETAQGLLAAGALTAVLLALGGHHHEVLRARLQHRAAAVTRTVAAAVRTTAYAALAVAGTLTLRHAIAVAIGSIALEAALLSRFAYRGARLWPPTRPHLRRDWFALSGWLFVTSATGALLINTDTLLVGWLGGPTETGWWVAASRLVAPIPLVIGAVWSVVLPVSVALQDRPRLERYLGLAARTSAAAALIAVAGTILVTPVMVLLFGSSYAAAAPAGRWLLAAYGVNVAVVLYGGLVLRLRLERELALVSLAQLVINTVGDIVLIPAYGAAGCAAVTTLVMTVGSAWAVMRVTRARGALLGTAA